MLDWGRRGVQGNGPGWGGGLDGPRDKGFRREHGVEVVGQAGNGGELLHQLAEGELDGEFLLERLRCLREEEGIEA